MVSGRYAYHTVRDRHITLHSSSLYRNWCPHISSRSTSYRRSNFDEDPYANKEDMDQHDIVARKDGGISLEEFCDCHMSDHTNEAVSQGSAEGRLPSHTNTYK